jgi:hypothetical protein
MDITSEIRTRLGDEWLPAVYRTKVRSQRTRSYALDVPQKENTAEILHTLLGIELKVGKKRLACPDLATARYLRVFARFGCRDVAVPYDITRISGIADELETSWQKTLLNVLEVTQDDSSPTASRKRRIVMKDLRDEMEAIGAGETMPAFKQSTTQRAG